MPKKDGSTEKNILSFDRNKIGLHDLPISYRLKPRYKNQSDPRNQFSLSGKYTATFILSKPRESLLPDDQISQSDFITGNSHLNFGQFNSDNTLITNVIEFNTTFGGKTYQIKELLNERGNLSSIQILPFMANDFTDAENIANNLIVPSVSYYSILFDVPLFIYQTDLVEVRTDAKVIHTFKPAIEVKLSSNGLLVFNIEKEMLPFIAFYREALNSNSYTYKYLCFYKIIEGVRFIRKQRKVEASKLGQQIREPSERIPATSVDKIEWLKKLFPFYYDWNNFNSQNIIPDNFSGRKINDVIDAELRPLRDSISHAFLDEEDVSLYLDDTNHLRKIYSLISVTKCIALFLLMSEFPHQFPIKTHLE